MGDSSKATPDRGFGRYLRRLRERRRLSVEETAKASAGVGKPLSAASISRWENGKSVPSIDALVAFSRLYDVSMAQLAERYDLERHATRVAAPEAVIDRDEFDRRIRGMVHAGLYADALTAFRDARAQMERLSPRDEDDVDRRKWLTRLRLGENECRLHLGYYGTVRSTAEEVLREPALDPLHRVIAWYHYVAGSYQLESFEVALAVLPRAEGEVDKAGVPTRLRAEFALLRGNVEVAMQCAGAAIEPFTRAAKLFRQASDRFGACRAETLLGAALVSEGKSHAGEKRLGAALRVAERNGYDGLKATVLSELASLAYRKKDFRRAERHAFDSNTIARNIGHDVVYFRNTWYLLQIAEAEQNRGLVTSYERTLESYIRKMPGHMPEAAAYRAREGQEGEGPEGGVES